MRLPSIAIGKLPGGPLDLIIDSTGLKIYGAGEWLQEKHKVRARRRSWRKLHLAVDANTGMIVASTMTETEAGDPSQVKPLLDQVPGEIASVTADGAYDGTPTYQTIAARGEQINVIIPPRADAILSGQADCSQSCGQTSFLSDATSRQIYFPLWHPAIYFCYTHQQTRRPAAPGP